MVAPQNQFPWAKIWTAAVLEPLLVRRIQAALHHPETNKVPEAHCLPMMLPPAGANHVATQVQILPTAHLRCKVQAAAKHLHLAHLLTINHLPVQVLRPAPVQNLPIAHLVPALVPRTVPLRGKHRLHHRPQTLSTMHLLVPVTIQRLRAAIYQLVSHGSNLKCIHTRSRGRWQQTINS